MKMKLSFVIAAMTIGLCMSTIIEVTGKGDDTKDIENFMQSFIFSNSPFQEQRSNGSRRDEPIEIVEIIETKPFDLTENSPIKPSFGNLRRFNSHRQGPINNTLEFGLPMDRLGFNPFLLHPRPMAPFHMPNTEESGINKDNFDKEFNDFFKPKIAGSNIPIASMRAPFRINPLNHPINNTIRPGAPTQNNFAKNSFPIKTGVQHSVHSFDPSQALPHAIPSINLFPHNIIPQPLTNSNTKDTTISVQHISPPDSAHSVQQPQSNAIQHSPALNLDSAKEKSSKQDEASKNASTKGYLESVSDFITSKGIGSTVAVLLLASLVFGSIILFCFYKKKGDQYALSA